MVIVTQSTMLEGTVEQCPSAANNSDSAAVLEPIAIRAQIRRSKR